MAEDSQRPRTSARWKAAHKVGGDLKTLLQGYRFYGEGHTIVEGMCETLMEDLAADLDEHDEMVFEVSSLALAFEGKPVFEAEDHKDSVTRPLFLDGVHQLIIEEGVSREEVGRLARVWSEAFDHDEDALSSFVTDFWEAEMEHIHVHAVEGFHEDEEDDADASGTARASRFAMLVDRLSSQRLLDTQADDVAKMAVMRITREDLALLEDAGIEQMRADDLTRQDRAQRAPVAELDGASASRLADGLALGSVEAVERALCALLQTTANPAVADADEVAVDEMMTRVFTALAARGHFDVLAGAVSLLGDESRAPNGLAVRARLLAHQQVLEPLLAAFDDVASAVAVVAVLRVASRDVAPRLLERLAQVPIDARPHVVDVLLELRPPARQVAAAIARSDTEVAMALLGLADVSSDAERAVLWRAALGHADPGLRLHVLDHVHEALYADLRSDLHGLLTDPEPKVRRDVLDLVVRHHDTTAIDALAALLARQELADSESRRVVAALARLGGPAAATVLRRQYDAQKSVAVRAAILLALARVEREGARDLLTSIAGKRFFVNKALKAAAIEGLERLDQPDVATSIPPAAPNAGRVKSSAPPGPLVPSTAFAPASEPNAEPSAPDVAAPPVGSVSSVPPSEVDDTPALEVGPYEPPVDDTPAIEVAPAESPVDDTPATEPAVHALEPVDAVPKAHDGQRRESRPVARSAPPIERRSRVSSAYRSVVPREERVRLSSRPATSTSPPAKMPSKRPKPPKRGAEALALVRDALERQSFTEAIAIASVAVQSHPPEEVDLYVALAEGHERGGSLAEAIDALQQAVLLAPERPDIAARLFELRGKT